MKERRRHLLSIFTGAGYDGRMSTLSERQYVDCPYNRARAYLRESLQGFAESGEAETLRLCVPLGEAGKPSMLEKEVTVRYGAGADPLHFDQPWTINWRPSNGGPYPDFAGTLTVRADEDYSRSVLELEGTYAPPFGAAGKMFDAVLGTRIASATAKEFLRRLGSQIADRHAREEQAKASNGLLKAPAPAE